MPYGVNIQPSSKSFACNHLEGRIMSPCAPTFSPYGVNIQPDSKSAPPYGVSIQPISKSFVYKHLGDQIMGT